MQHTIEPIGILHSPFKQKFAIPRQSQALSVAKGSIKFAENINIEQALDGIDAFSHLWLLFLFHENLAAGFTQKVRPPRLGGNKKIGVFATRSTFRPNGIGMSLVQNLGVTNKCLQVGGIDLLDQTPIVDIKPYLPYADVAAHATAGYAATPPEHKLTVSYTETAAQQAIAFSAQHPDFMVLLSNILEQDPRPAYKQNNIDNKRYHIDLYNAQISFVVIDNGIEVFEIIPQGHAADPSVK